MKNQLQTTNLQTLSPSLLSHKKEKRKEKDLVAKANMNLLQNLHPFLQTPQVKAQAPHQPMLCGDGIVIVIVIVERAERALK